MIDERWRYFAPGGAITPGGPSTWFILDWDQRRTIAITGMDEEQESEDLAVGHLRKHIDALGPDVIQRPDHVKIVLRSDPLELGRLTPNVDLVSYMPSTNAAEPRKVAFKYYFLFQFLYKVWHEMNLWMRCALPTHPHLIPFDRLVLDGAIRPRRRLGIERLGGQEKEWKAVFRFTRKQLITCTLIGRISQRPPPSDFVFSDGEGNSSVVTMVVLTTCSRRRGQRGKGVAVLNWENVLRGFRLGTGAVYLPVDRQSVSDTEDASSVEQSS